MTPAAALFPLLLLFGSSRPARAFVGPGGPSGGGDRPRALPSAWARAEDVDFDVDGAGRPSATAESKKEKRPRDRAIDRRKSPALWRYDLDYSVAPSASSSSSASASSSGAASSSSGARSPPPVRPRSPPELMSPAGGWPQLKAAVANGADAVYLGLTSYSARARAANFDPDPSLLRSDDGMGEQDRGEESDFGGRLEAAARGGRKADPRDGPPPSKRNAKRDDGAYEPPADGPASLARAVQYCHAHRVRVYVAFNTLVFDAELPEVQDLVEQIWNCGADAIIVQDAGVSRIVKEVVDRLSAKMRAKGLGYDGRGLDGAPLEIHASTQQTVSCADGVKFAAERTNATRVVSSFRKLSRTLLADPLADSAYSRLAFDRLGWLTRHSKSSASFGCVAGRSARPKPPESGDPCEVLCSLGTKFGLGFRLRAGREREMPNAVFRLGSDPFRWQGQRGGAAEPRSNFRLHLEKALQCQASFLKKTTRVSFHFSFEELSMDFSQEESARAEAAAEASRLRVAIELGARWQPQRSLAQPLSEHPPSSRKAKEAEPRSRKVFPFAPGKGPQMSSCCGFRLEPAGVDLLEAYELDPATAVVFGGLPEGDETVLCPAYASMASFEASESAGKFDRNGREEELSSSQRQNRFLGFNAVAAMLGHMNESPRSDHDRFAVGHARMKCVSQSGRCAFRLRGKSDRSFRSFALQPCLAARSNCRGSKNDGFVLGRELSLSEITQISANTDTEIEAFVHGALCVSYSGQCFSSEAWGGRSANRGQCAQACRLPYGLIANGELRHLSFDGIEGIMGGKVGNGGDEEGVGYLLSPQDLCGLEQVEGLVRAGVSCLKIEGRLKDASYVAATTRAYRQAIDAAWAELSSEHSGDAAAVPPPPSRRVLSSSDERVSRRDLTHVFARGQDEVHDGLTPGFFEGPRHQRLVRGRSPRHRGVHVGRVVGAERGALVVALDDDGDEEDGVPLKRGDGVVIDRGRPQEEELGGPIYDVTLRDDGRAVVRFGRDVERRWKDNDRKRRAAPLAPRGAHVWKTSDATTAKRMRKLAELDPPKSPARVVVEGRIGTPLTVRVVDEGSGRAGEASSSNEETLEEAKGSGVGEKSIAKAIGTLGNSRWSLSELDLSGLEEGSWCPMSWVKDARRRALEDLEANFPSARAHPASDVVGDSVVDLLLDEMSRDVHADRPETRAKLSVLARNYEQVDALCNMILSDSESSAEAISEIIVDFLEIDGIRAAVSRIQEAKARSSRDLRVVVASPRVIKPGEEGIWRTLLKTNPDGILVRSAGLLYRLTQLGGAGGRVAIPSPGGETVDVTIPELIGDFSLNAANAIAAHELLRSGLSRITAAYDLSGDAIAELATLLGDKASRLEAVVHQHMPIFHTEHCVFARFLSKGNSYRDCGHVCTRNTVHLRDQGGKDNLVLADMGCRNTVFMAESQSGVASMDQWIRAGIRHLRIELVDESGSDAVKIVSSYLQFLSKEMAADEVWNVLEGIPDSNGRLGGV
ncbi:hypothetical protein ACHAWF_018258, partial [Thalassiosira exigua]